MQGEWGTGHPDSGTGELWARESAWLRLADSGTFQQTHLGGRCPESRSQGGREW